MPVLFTVPDNVTKLLSGNKFESVTLVPIEFNDSYPEVPPVPMTPKIVFPDTILSAVIPTASATSLLGIVAGK